LIDNSKAYKEAENKTEFISRLAKDLNVSAPLLYQVLEFYRKFPDFDKFIQEYNTGKKTLRWSDVRPLLAENPNNCGHGVFYIEKLILTRKKCKICNKTLDEKKDK
ncbi:MAG: hypothetical protein N2482_03685, partial [Patescibacteria group bacterium]|nr:hypothetical protein [Patescibacteria group bacterium]